MPSGAARHVFDPPLSRGASRFDRELYFDYSPEPVFYEEAFPCICSGGANRSSPQKAGCTPACRGPVLDTSCPLAVASFLPPQKAGKRGRRGSAGHLGTNARGGSGSLATRGFLRAGQVGHLDQLPQPRGMRPLERPLPPPLQRFDLEVELLVPDGPFNHDVFSVQAGGVGRGIRHVACMTPRGMPPADEGRRHRRHRCLGI